jgi:hypothetical protein
MAAAELIEGTSEIDDSVVRQVADLVGIGQAMAMVIMVMRQRIGVDPGDILAEEQTKHVLRRHGLLIE